MTRSSFVSTAALSALATAALVLVVFGARPTNAGSRTRKSAAISNEVRFEGTLAKAGDGWRIDYLGRNGGKKEQQCQLIARVMQQDIEVMARVAPVPRELGTTTFAAVVPAGGEAKGEVALPDKVSALLKASGRKSKSAEGSKRSFVTFEAKCQPTTDQVI